jgi:hypothetical protein
LNAGAQKRTEQVRLVRICRVRSIFSGVFSVGEFECQERTHIASHRLGIIFGKALRSVRRVAGTLGHAFL